MKSPEEEENLLRLAALRNADSVFLARRRAEEALERKTEELAQSVAMMRATLESTADGILATDNQGNVTDFNTRFVQMWRLPAEIMGLRQHQKLLDFIAPQLVEPAQFLALVKEIARSSPPDSFHLLECVDGRILESYSKVQRIGERDVGRVWSLRDITVRRRAEEDLRRSEKALADFFENAAVGLHWVGPEGKIVRANRTELKLLGYSEEEYVGHHLAEFHADAPLNGDSIKKLGGGEDLNNYEVRLRCKDGSIKHVVISSNMLHEKGKFVHSRCFMRDLTEQKRTDGARAHLAALVESSDDAIISKTLDGTIRTWNQGAERMFGYGAEEVVGKSITLLIPPDRANEELEILKRLRKGERIEHYETVRRRKDGTLFDVALTVSPVRDAGGVIIGASKIARDVTDRKQAEAALRASEARFRQLADAMPQMVWTARPDGYVDYFNRRWYDYTGAREGLGGDQSWSRFLHSDDVQRCLDAWHKSVATGQASEIEYRLKNRAGEYRWYLARALPARNEAGEITRWYGSSTDIHEQKLIADALQEEYIITEQFNSVSRALATELDLGRIVQIITDAGTRVTRAQFGAFFSSRVDERGASDTLYTLSGMRREPFEKFVLPLATALFGPTLRGEGVILLDDVRKDPRFRQNAFSHGMPAGDLPVVSYLAVPVFARSGEVLGGLFFGHAAAGVFTERDGKVVTTLAAQAAAAMGTARLYQAEKQARDAAEQANKTKDYFIAALSHELRTPLTPVLAILSSVGEDFSLPPVVAADLETVRRNVELEIRLIDDLLDLTRITRGKLELHWGRFTVDQMIEGAINTCRPDFKAKQLALVRDLRTTQQTIIADSARITQVLWNLLKNAIKFTPAGGTITVRSRISSVEGVTRLTIAVEDTGIGIEAARLDRVFDAFEQGGQKITRQFGGLGLGLAISKAIAESHHGTLSVASDGPGRGSIFTLTLPSGACELLAGVVELPQGTRLASIPARDRPAATTRSLRVLLVEDHADTAAIIVRLLRRSGHEVIQTATVAAALQTAEKEMRAAGIDLVVSDLGLPDGSGLEMMRELSIRHGLNGIALSGYGTDSDREQSIAAGFSRHLTKPIDIVTLPGTIAEMTQGS